MPLLVFAVIAALVTGGAFVASSVGLGPGETEARQFLPEDGAVTFERTETTRELQTEVSNQVTESARLSGASGLLSGDGKFVDQILIGTVAEHETIQLWRTTTSPIDDPSIAAQTMRLYRANTSIDLLGESTPNEAYVYRPALVELPEHVRPGSDWNSAGSASASLDYRSQFHAEAGTPGCLEVSGEIRLLTKAGDQHRVLSIGRTWCEGQGLVGQRGSFGDIAYRTDPIAPVAPDRIVTTSAVPQWRDPSRWKAKPFTTISVNPTLGEGPMVGSPLGKPPVRTESGLVIRPTFGLNDLVATTPKTQQAWTSVWRAHPGGSILTLSGFGNIVLVTTSAREVVAYSDTGVRLWQLGLADLGPTAPVRSGDRSVVLVDLAGMVHNLDILTGQVLWQHQLASDVNVSPVVGAGLAVIMDRAGTTTALDVADGHERWTADLQGTAAGVLGDTVVVLQDQTAHALAAETGRHRWVRPFYGTFTDLATFGDRLVVATKSETSVLDNTGKVVLVLPAFLRITATADHFVGWGASDAEVIDRQLKVVTTWDLPGLTLAVQDWLPAATPDSVLLVDGTDWNFTVWSDAA